MLTAQQSAASGRVRQIVASVLEIELDDVDDDAGFDGDLGVDSLEKLTIITRIEDEFGVTLDDGQAAAIRSVRDAVALLGDAGAATGQLSLVDRLVGRHLAAGRGHRVSYIDPDVGEVSYARLYEAARGYAALLRAAGVAPATRGLIIADDSIATVVAVLGMWWHGCVPVPVSPLLVDSDIAYIADDCAPGLVHLDVAPRRRRSLEGLLGSLPVLMGEPIRARLSSRAAEDALGPAPASLPGDHEALVQYTSGSSGTPKGVRQSAGAIDAMLASFGSVLGLRRDDLVLSTARMTFGYGFGSSVLCSLAAGAGTVLIRGVDVHSVSAALRQHRPTVLCLVPRMYAALLDHAEQRGNGVAARSPRLCSSAGEDCPAALGDRIRRAFGADLLNCFGATEVMHVVLTGSGSNPGSLGPVPGVTASVRDEQGSLVPDGAEGRLHIAGPTVALGYIGQPDAAAKTFADGGAYTGDIVRRAEDGRLRYVCRADDLLNLGGYKVAPGEIESVARDIDGVAECAVVQGADENGLAQAVLYVVTSDGADQAVIRRAIVSAVRTRLSTFKRPARLEFCDALPATVTGKVAKYKLKTQAEPRGGTGPPPQAVRPAGSSPSGPAEREVAL